MAATDDALTYIRAALDDLARMVAALQADVAALGALNIQPRPMAPLTPSEPRPWFGDGNPCGGGVE